MALSLEAPKPASASYGQYRRLSLAIRVPGRRQWPDFHPKTELAGFHFCGVGSRPRRRDAHYMSSKDLGRSERHLLRQGYPDEHQRGDHASAAGWWWRIPLVGSW